MGSERGRNLGAWSLEGARKKVGREARRIVAQGKKVLLKARLGERWTPSGEQLARRDYPSYEAYLEHQRTKFDAFREKSIERHDRRFYAALRERLAVFPGGLKRRAVLCLAARQGTEVRAFIDEGAFAIGIDLNPGKENRYVVVGDFHHLQFSDGSVDVVYSNSVDHAFDLDRLLGEIRRVLAGGGVFLAEVGFSEGGEGRQFYEALAWSRVEDLIASIERAGFALEQRSPPFDVPWPGEQLLFRKRG